MIGRKQAKMIMALDKYTQSISEAEKYGKRIGKRIVKRYSAENSRKKEGLQTDIASTVLAEILYQSYKKDQEADCQELLKKWIEEKFWGRIAEEHISELEEIWQLLHDKKYTKNNKCGYGDIDGDIWVEYPKKNKKRKIIIHKSHCTFADNDTHIFIIEEGVFGITLHIRTVWPRENNKGGYECEKSAEYPDGWFSWGDDRDIKIPSLNTYRNRDFKYSYSDCRDKGYVLTIDGMSMKSRVEFAGSMQSEIQHALWLIKNMKNWIEDNER